MCLERWAIYRDGLFIAAVVSLGGHDFLCKDDSKCLLHDVTRNAIRIKLFVKRPYFISTCLTVLNLAFPDASASQLFKNNKFIEISSFSFKWLPTE